MAVSATLVPPAKETDEMRDTMQRLSDSCCTVYRSVSVSAVGLKIDCFTSRAVQQHVIIWSEQESSMSSFFC
jgi:hypothetical protein